MKRTFKYSISAIMLILITVVSMSACGDTQVDHSEPPTEESSGSPSKTSATATIAIDKCHYCSNYSNGFAWNLYSLYPKEYSFRTSLTDKTGKMILSWDSGLSTFTEHYEGQELVFPGFSYKDGYVYLQTDEGFCVIDTSGKVRYTCTVDSENTILAYGGGYVITKNYTADFDSSGYTYTVYSPTGSIVSQTKTGYNLSNLCYYGRGIFGFNMDEETNCYFYNAQSNALSKEILEGLHLENASFQDDDAIVYLGSGGTWKDSNFTSTYHFLKEDGTIVSMELGEEQVLSESIAVSGTQCLLVTKSNKLYIFDSTTESTKEVPLSYQDKILWDATFAFGEGKTIVPLQGDDGKQYIIVIDENGTLLIEPTVAKQYTGFSDHRMILTTDDDVCVYDENMKLVYSLSQLDFFDFNLNRLRANYYSLSKYSDGVTVLSEYNGSQHDTYLYLDVNGTLLFDAFDISDSIQY